MKTLVKTRHVITLLAMSAFPVLGADAGLNCFAPAPDPAAKIAACTRAITIGKMPAGTHALALLARAEAFVTTGDHAKALADYDAALALTPGDIAALMGRAKLHEADDVMKAEADYSAALAKDPALGDAYVRRGALRLARGDTDGGIADLGEARRFNPNNPALYKIRGAHYLDTDKSAMAALELEQAAHLDPKDVEIQNLLGAAWLKINRVADAIAAYNAALALKSDDGGALRGRATAYARQQNYAAATADFTAALALDAKDAAALQGRGMVALQSGDGAAANADFTALLALRPTIPGGLFFRANARLQNGDYPNAIADFSAFIARRPNDAEAHIARGTARQFVGDYAGAESDFAAVLAREPDAARPLAARGFVRVMLGKYSDAVGDLTKAAALPNAPPDIALWRFIAEKHAGLKGEKALAAAAKQLPSDQWPAPAMQYFLGTLTGDEMLTAARQEPISQRPGEPTGLPGRLCEAYYYLGQAALMQKDTAEAVKLFKAAVGTGMKRYTEYAGAHAELARLAP